MQLPRKLVTFYHRNVKAVDMERFQDDVRRSALFTDPADAVDDFAAQIDETVSDILRFTINQVRLSIIVIGRSG